MKFPQSSPHRNLGANQQARDDQVSALYELGLIPNPAKDPRETKVTQTKGKESGARSPAELNPRKREFS